MSSNQAILGASDGFLYIYIYADQLPIQKKG